MRSFIAGRGPGSDRSQQVCLLRKLHKKMLICNPANHKIRGPPEPREIAGGVGISLHHFIPATAGRTANRADPPTRCRPSMSQKMAGCLNVAHFRIEATGEVRLKPPPPRRHAGSDGHRTPTQALVLGWHTVCQSPTISQAKLSSRIITPCTAPPARHKHTKPRVADVFRLPNHLAA